MSGAILAGLGGLLVLFLVGAARIDRELRDPERKREFHRRVAELPRAVGLLMPVLLPVLQLLKVMERPPARAPRRPSKPTGADVMPSLLPWALRAGLLLILILASGPAPLLAGVLVLVLFLACVFPWATVRLVLIPLGLWFPSWLWALQAGVVWCDGRSQRHRREAAVVAGALALLRRRTRNERALAWLERRLAAAPVLRASTVFAHGVLAAARGQDGSARDLFEFCAELPGRICPRIARASAREWLCADAAARGEWAAVLELAAVRPRTRATRLLRLAARRFTAGGAGAPAWRLWLRWSWCPRRRRTLALVRQALAWVPTTSPATDDPAAPAPGDDPLAVAALLHARLLSRVDGARAVELVACGRAWQAAFHRGDVLELASAGRDGTTDGPAAVARVAGAVEADLIAISRASRIPLAALDAAGCTLLGTVADELRASEVRAVDEAAVALSDRVTDRRPLPLIDEVAEFVRLRRRYVSLVRTAGHDSASIAFASVHRALCNLGHWLHSEREARLPAHFMFAWMIPHARAAGNDDAAALLAKNADCGF